MLIKLNGDVKDLFYRSAKVLDSTASSGMDTGYCDFEEGQFVLTNGKLLILIPFEVAAEAGSMVTESFKFIINKRADGVYMESIDGDVRFPGYTHLLAKNQAGGVIGSSSFDKWVPSNNNSNSIKLFELFKLVNTPLSLRSLQLIEGNFAVFAVECGEQFNFVLENGVEIIIPKLYG